MTIHVRTKVSGITSDIQLEVVADGARFAVAARHASSDFAAVLSGNSTHTSAGTNGGAAPSGMTTAKLGEDASAANQLNGTLLRFRHRASRTNQELVDAVTAYAGFPLET